MRARLADMYPWMSFSAILTLCVLSLSVEAQQYARNEVTVGVNSQLGASNPYPTFSASYTYNLSPSLAIEGTVIPTSQFLQRNGYSSGRKTLAMGGVKTGWRGRTWGIYGKVQVGVGSFSCGGYISDPTPSHNCGRLTNFALEYGGVVERKLSKRWALRLDAAHLMMPVFDSTLVSNLGGVLTAYLPAEWLQGIDARIGITRSFGALHEAEPEHIPKYARWDVGALFALQPRYLPSWQMMNAYPAWGLWASWNFNRHFSWDSAVMHSGRNPGGEVIDYQAGGRAFEALTGLKAGIRRDHMGYFTKVRGGTITFGETERQISWSPSNPFNLDSGMFTNPVLDVGGVYEIYPSRHFILRADAGSATIFYQPKNVIQQGQTIAIHGQAHTGMLISFGAGFRF